MEMKPTDKLLLLFPGEGVSTTLPVILPPATLLLAIDAEEVLLKAAMLLDRSPMWSSSGLEQGAKRSDELRGIRGRAERREGFERKGSVVVPQDSSLAAVFRTGVVSLRPITVLKGRISYNLQQLGYISIIETTTLVSLFPHSLIPFSPSLPVLVHGIVLMQALPHFRNMYPRRERR